MKNKMSYPSRSLQCCRRCDRKRLKEYLHMRFCSPGRSVPPAHFFPCDENE